MVSYLLLVWVAAAVVDCLPVVPEDKHEKLTNVLKKIYSQIGNVREGVLAAGAKQQHWQQQPLGELCMVAAASITAR
jgi:hypothetical protein